MSSFFFFFNSFSFLGDYSRPLESLFLLHPRPLKSRGCAKVFKLSGPIREGRDCFHRDFISGFSTAPRRRKESLGLLAELTVGGRVVGGVHLLRRAIFRYLLHGGILRHVGSLYSRVGSNVRSWVSQ